MGRDTSASFKVMVALTDITIVFTHSRTKQHLRDRGAFSDGEG